MQQCIPWSNIVRVCKNICKRMWDPILPDSNILYWWDFFELLLCKNISIFCFYISIFYQNNTPLKNKYIALSVTCAVTFPFLRLASLSCRNQMSCTTIENCLYAFVISFGLLCNVMGLAIRYDNEASTHVSTCSDWYMISC